MVQGLVIGRGGALLFVFGTIFLLFMVFDIIIMMIFLLNLAAADLGLKFF